MNDYLLMKIKRLIPDGLGDLFLSWSYEGELIVDHYAILGDDMAETRLHELFDILITNGYDAVFHPRNSNMQAYLQVKLQK